LYNYTPRHTTALRLSVESTTAVSEQHHEQEMANGDEQMMSPPAPANVNVASPQRAPQQSPKPMHSPRKQPDTTAVLQSIADTVDDVVCGRVGSSAASGMCTAYGLNIRFVQLHR
jgi:hypothetical protein